MDKAKFYSELRKTLYKSGLAQSAVVALDAIIDETVGKKIPAAHVAYMMATAFHESGRNLVPITENLNYTTAARIKAVWPSRFATTAAAQPYVKQPQKLANLVYGGRLGNTGANDGWTYRGRGHVQTTGKTNYQKVSKYIGQDAVKNPDLLLDIKNSVIALVHCMIDGVYTGKKLSDFNLPRDYYGARAIINGDKARKEGKATIGETIGNYAKQFENALNAAGFEKGKVVTSAPTKPVEVEKKPTSIDPTVLQDLATDPTPKWFRIVFDIIAKIFKIK